jgi:hypothetical protein
LNSISSGGWNASSPTRRNWRTPEPSPNAWNAGSTPAGRRAAGVVGGVIGASQLMMSNVFQRVETAGDSARLISTSFNHVSAGADWVAAVSNGGTAVWVAAGLAVIMMGFVLTRVIGEI